MHGRRIGRERVKQYRVLPFDRGLEMTKDVSAQLARQTRII
jgi:hypothetical protein